MSNLKTYFKIRITILIHSKLVSYLTLKTPSIWLKISTNFISTIFIPNIFKGHKMISSWIIEVRFKYLHITTSSCSPSNQHTCSITTSSHSRLSNTHEFIEVLHSGQLLNFNINRILTNSTIWIIHCRHTKQ